MVEPTSMRDVCQFIRLPKFTRIRQTRLVFTKKEARYITTIGMSNNAYTDSLWSTAID